MKPLSVLIEEALQDILIERYNSLGLDEEKALVVFVLATQRCRGILRMAQRWEINIENLSELAPEKLDEVERFLSMKANPGDETMVDGAG